MFIRRETDDRLGADFEQFVLDRSSALLRTAVLLVGDHGHAEDLVQTTLLRVALRWRSASAQPEAYARQVLVNLARDRWRLTRRRVAEQTLPESDASEPSGGRDPAEVVANRSAVRQALATLPRRQREVVVLRFFADLSVAQTAAALRTSEGTVKAHTSRALGQLRRVLGDQHADQIREERHVRQ